MTNISRPIHLHLAANSNFVAPRMSLDLEQQATTRRRTESLSTDGNGTSILSPNDSSLPSQIMPYLYVGNQKQTNREMLSKLNISYILSLQSLPRFLTNLKESKDLSQSDIITTPTGNSAINIVDFYTSSQRNQNQIRRHNCSKNQRRHQTRSMNTHLHPSYDSQQVNINQTDLAFLPPSNNSSKDYLVKFSDHGPFKEKNSTANTVSNENIDLMEIVEGENGNIENINKATTTNGSNRLEQIRGKMINISDTFEQLLGKVFEEANNFIEEARRNKCNILIHCNAGISRSPTIAIAYLMKWKRLHLQDAYNFVKRCRPQISPNLNFMGQLVRYERRLGINQEKTHGSNSLEDSPRRRA